MNTLLQFRENQRVFFCIQMSCLCKRVIPRKGMYCFAPVFLAYMSVTVRFSLSCEGGNFGTEGAVYGGNWWIIGLILVAKVSE